MYSMCFIAIFICEHDQDNKQKLIRIGIGILPAIIPIMTIFSYFTFTFLSECWWLPDTCTLPLTVTGPPSQSFTLSSQDDATLILSHCGCFRCRCSRWCNCFEKQKVDGNFRGQADSRGNFVLLHIFN